MEQKEFKDRTEKIESIRNKIIEESKNSSKREENITLISSLVKYDTPFLVSSSVTNKKTLEDLEQNEEKAEEYLRNIIFSSGPEGEGANREYSVRDALNKILPPKKITETTKDEKSQKLCQTWVQYVSCSPVTKADVVNLQEGLDRKLQTKQARETGICPIRESLYNECFDELIRQITLNCLERGILLKRIKKEIEMTINSYQTLYESSIAYGIRTLLIAEEKKKDYEVSIQNLDEECTSLENGIQDLKDEITRRQVEIEQEREEENKKHDEMIKEQRAKAEQLKNQLKDKLAIKS
ncbi:MAG: dynein arm light chain [archaeon]|nr:dynein arm light chain [archaeon]